MPVVSPRFAALFRHCGEKSPAGLLRLGITHYNTAEEIAHVVEALERIDWAPGGG